MSRCDSNASRAAERLPLNNGENKGPLKKEKTTYIFLV